MTGWMPMHLVTTTPFKPVNFYALTEEEYEAISVTDLIIWSMMSNA